MCDPSNSTLTCTHDIRHRYGDHGATTSGWQGGNWDDEYGTWNRGSVVTNNDGPAYHYNGMSLPYRCCTLAAVPGEAGQEALTAGVPERGWMVERSAACSEGMSHRCSVC